MTAAESIVRPPDDAPPAVAGALAVAGADDGEADAFAATLLELVRRGRFQAQVQEGDLLLMPGHRGFELAPWEVPVAALLTDVLSDGSVLVSELFERLVLRSDARRAANPDYGRAFHHARQQLLAAERRRGRRRRRERWTTFRRSLRELEETALVAAPERPIWEELIVHGMAFGCSDAVCRAARLRFPVPPEHPDGMLWFPHPAWRSSLLGVAVASPADPAGTTLFAGLGAQLASATSSHDDGAADAAALTPDLPPDNAGWAYLEGWGW
jgi:hypothetical protein